MDYGQPPSGQGARLPSGLPMPAMQSPSGQGLGLPLSPSSGSGPWRPPSQPGAGFGPRVIQPSVSPVRSPGLGQPLFMSPDKIQQQALFGSPNKQAVLLALKEVSKPPPAGGLDMAMYAVRMKDRHERDEKERVDQSTPDLLLPCHLRCNQTAGSVEPDVCALAERHCDAYYTLAHSLQSIRGYWTRYGAPGDFTKGPNLPQSFYHEVWTRDF